MTTQTPISIPSLGESITEVVLGQWLVDDGAWVERDAPLVEIESDKVTQELPSPVSGRISISKQTGEDCHIGDVIGSIDQSAAKPVQEPFEAERDSAATGEDCDIEDVIGSVDERTAKPTQESFEAEGDSAATIDVTTETVASAAQTRKVTPLAKKVADDLGVSLEDVSGSGPSGRITKSDVLHAEHDSSKTPSPIEPDSLPSHRGIRRERMSTLRKRIAERLVTAQHDAAMLTTFNEADMSKVIALRKLHKEEFNDRYGS